MAERPLLYMHGIDKRFAGIPALSDASFEVEQGEVHALVGQNGAGKSTLIKVLTGYYRRDAGAVELLGKPFEVRSPQQAQAGGISTIYQELNLVPLRSVTENICLGREQRRMGLLDWRRARANSCSFVVISARRPARGAGDARAESRVPAVGRRTRA